VEKVYSYHTGRTRLTHCMSRIRASQIRMIGGLEGRFLDIKNRLVTHGELARRMEDLPGPRVTAVP